MAKPAEPRARKPLFLDPDNVAVQLVDQITFHGVTGNLVDITCCSVRKTPLVDGGLATEAVVVARLRFDLELAEGMRDRLTRMIETAKARQIAPPDGLKN